MIAIKNPILKKQFEQFSKLDSEEEKKAFWENFSKDFGSISETDQEVMRQAWTENMSSVDKRLKEIGNELKQGIGEINVFPADAKEAKLITELLSRMKVKFKVA